MQRIGDYILQHKLGDGRFSEVFAADKVDDPTSKYAIKIISKSCLGMTAEGIQKEIEVLDLVRGMPRLVEFVTSITTDNCVYLVMRQYRGGSLLDLINKSDQFPESTAQYYFSTMMTALRDMHKLGVVHRDIKPENLLLDEDGNLFLADFTMATKLAERPMMLWDGCGTKYYTAPEIEEAHKGYRGDLADVWAAGVTLYGMLTGKLYFLDKYDLILQNELDELRDISPACRAMLEGVLQPDPTKRLSVDDILAHPWIVDDTRGGSFAMGPPVNSSRLSGDSNFGNITTVVSTGTTVSSASLSASPHVVKGAPALRKGSLYATTVALSIKPAKFNRRPTPVLDNEEAVLSVPVADVHETGETLKSLYDTILLLCGTDGADDSDLQLPTTPTVRSINQLASRCDVLARQALQRSLTTPRSTEHGTTANLPRATSFHFLDE